MTGQPIDLSGRVALVTGASRGIGAAVAKAYARAGAHVIVMARSTAKLELLDDDIRSLGGTATLMPIDLRDPAPLDNIGPAIATKFGRLDIFVANAGVLGALSPIGHQKAGDWDKVMAINVTANFRLVRTLDPLLRASDAGRAIFVTSGASAGKAYWGAYGVSKAALDALALTYAAETATTNLRVNLLSPGPTRTAMRTEAFPGEKPEDLKPPEALDALFLELAAPECTRHGEILRAA